MDDYPVHTIPNHHQAKLDILPETFIQLILAATTSPEQQRRPLPYLLSLSFFYGPTERLCLLVVAKDKRTKKGREKGADLEWRRKGEEWRWQELKKGLRDLKRAQYFSRRFILVENMYANQSEAEFLCLLLKSFKNVSRGNQSIHFNKENMKLLRQLSFFPC